MSIRITISHGKEGQFEPVTFETSADALRQAAVALAFEEITTRLAGNPISKKTAEELMLMSQALVKIGRLIEP